MEAWVLEQKALLELEADEERAQSTSLLMSSKHSELAELGIALLKLYTGSNTTSLFGRACLTFHRYNAADYLPAHRLSNGDIVGCFDQQSPIHLAKPICEGVVHKVKRQEIDVLFQDATGLTHGGPYHLAIVASDVTMQRYKHCLNDLEKEGNAGHHKPVNLCFNGVEKPLMQFEERMDLEWRSDVSLRIEYDNR